MMQATTIKLQPIQSSKIHTSSITGIIWSPDSTKLYTSSHDSSIRCTDVNTQNPLLTLNGNKVVTCLAGNSTGTVMATGHADARLRLWDMRIGDTPTSTTNETIKQSHKSYISSIKFSPKNPYQMSTGSYDGTVKTWDVRCSLPMHTIKGHLGDKVMDIGYGEEGIFSCGSDGEVKKWLF
jgi:ribosome biogenesis protein YTM1